MIVCNCCQNDIFNTLIFQILTDLAAAGVSVSDQDEDGFTPIQYAAKNQTHKLLGLLMGML